METDLLTGAGGVRIIDFMPMRDGHSTLVRIVTGLRGTTKVRLELALRFDYGGLPPWIEPTESGFLARVGPDAVALHAPVETHLQEDCVSAEFEVGEGQRLAFVLRYTTSDQPAPPGLDAEAALAETQRFWRDWIGRFDGSRTHWPEAVRRSLITLKALVHQPSGGLIAAPTTSLPEAPGGDMNWDYRYCWIRDGSFAIGALTNAGYCEEAERWRDWVLRAVAGTPGRMQIMYRVDGARHMPQWHANLPGWNYAEPVRIGNIAFKQHQVDVYGELLHALDLARRNGLTVTEHQHQVAARIAFHLEQVWDTPGAGIWESRKEPRHYTYARAMASVGLQAVANDCPALDRDSAERMKRLSARLREELLQQAWNHGLNSFTGYYGGQELDASLLLLPVVGFLPATEPRMTATIDAIGRTLGEGGLIRRKKANPNGPDEGAFLVCSCWMADCLDLQGRRDEACAQLERVLSVGNDLGLFSEEYNVPGQHLAGNFPQALTHLGIVNTALGLSGPQPVRGG